MSYMPHVSHLSNMDLTRRQSLCGDLHALHFLVKSLLLHTALTVVALRLS